MSGTQPESGDQHGLIARLHWFRADHPDSEIETSLVHVDASMAVCRALLSTGSSGAASGHGSALREDSGPGYVEVSENRALSRALTALGYGATTAEDVQATDDGPPPAVPIDMVSARTLLREEAPAEQYDEPANVPHPIRAATQDKPAEAPEENSGADVNWNKFWTWARQRGYTTAKELNELLGVDNVLAYTPREVRQMLVKYEMDNPPGGQDE